ncbi:hypothetical protein ZIOFF_066569 [Zingiber officinale]|uniref:Pentatricopeptide repeat-containing protein n=1 Tax=Zingiber officinale TaxID=94328 RepID=A0A8J5KC73_ZINOF|nr:hypothetical protein ZIOFF_066569 [Zingiber officinale]
MPQSDCSTRRKVGACPPTNSLTVMINGDFSNGFPTLGFEMYNEMKQSGVCPNLYTCNVLISECCREQEFCSAFQPFDEMSQKGILPNIVTYNLSDWWVLQAKQGKG